MSFDVLLLGASRVRSERSRPLEGAPHSCMPLAGVFGEGASVVEDMTRLKRQWHCDASGLHLCTLSLLFRRSGSALLSRREAQPCCLQATVTWGLLPVVPAGGWGGNDAVGLQRVLPSDGLLLSVLVKPLDFGKQVRFLAWILLRACVCVWV